jgi:hypothetical protein
MRRPKPRHSVVASYRLLGMRVRAFGRAVMAEWPFSLIDPLAAWLTRKLTRA